MTLRRTTLSKTYPDMLSAQRTDLYTCYQPKAQTSTHVISPTHRPLHMLSAQRTDLYTCYQPNAQTSTHVISPTHRPLHMLSAQSTALYLKIHNAHHRDTHAPGGIRIRNLSKRANANPPLRPLGHRDRLILHIAQINKN